jgi:hypothetical protein
MFVVKIPLWKAYLYSLMERIRIYRSININYYRFGFNLNEKFLLKSMFKKYTQKGGYKQGYRELRSVLYSKLVKAVKNQAVIATPEEMEIINKISIVNKLNVEDLMNFEIKTLKEFAKEVGINAIAAAKMKPEELAKEIIKAVDPKKGYSTDFVKWYDSIDDSFINSIEVEGGAENVATGEDNSELIEIINGCTKMGELKELIADESVKDKFKGFDISQFKLAGPTKKALVEFLNSDKSAGSDNSDDKMEIAKAVMEAATDDDLVAVIEASNDYFTDFDPGEVTDLDAMKQAIIKHLGVELEAPKAEKKMSLKDKIKAKSKTEPATEAVTMVVDFDPTPGNFDPEVVYEGADKLKIGDLKKFYSQLSKITRIEMASNKPGITKDALMDNIGNALMDLSENGPKEVVCECPPAAEEGELEITRKVVEDAAKAEDKDTLAAMCEKMGISLNALEKRNVNRMKDKLLAKLPAEEAPAKGKLGLLKKKAEVKEEPATPPSESKLVEIFSVIEKMVLEETEEKAIVDAVTPLYKANGVSPLLIKKRVKILIEVIQVEHGIKK